jgi:peptidoglycan/LPS O-acetylase OafA/YrhL
VRIRRAISSSPQPVSYTCQKFSAGRSEVHIPTHDEALTVTTSSGKESTIATYYPWFDWLRLGLATVVLLSHSGVLNAWQYSAGFAVQVFFALSGWLIGGMLFKLTRSDLRRFYFNRALRIWWPYFLALGFLIGVSLIRDRVTHKWLEFIFYKATFVYNLFGPRQLALHAAQMPLGGTGNHFWSVNAEEQFYLLAPLLLVIAPRRFGRNVITWVILASVAYVTRTYASIVFGVLAAVIANTRGAFHDHYLCRIIAGIVVVVSALGFVTGIDNDLVAPVCAVAIVLLLAIKGERHRWGELAGGMSYPLYLNAWIAGFAVHAVFKRVGLEHSPLQIALSFIASFALAAVLYWHVDRRILASRRRLYTPQRATIAIRIAYGAVALGVCVGLALYNRV